MEIGYFLYLETYDIVVKKQTIKDTELSNVLKGLRIIQISDPHINGFGIREKKLIKIINDIQPDIIFITGDLISDEETAGEMGKVIREMGKAEGRYIIAVPGNSDHKDIGYKNDKLLIRDGFDTNSKNVILLKNESIKVKILQNSNARNLYIIGLDDNYTWNDDFFKAIHNVPENALKILFAHAPNIVEKIDTEGINLILSGHTHGGQVILPFIGPIVTNQVCNAKREYISGLYNDEGTKLYVNKGIGTSVIPIRFLCKPEVTLFEFF